MNHKIKQVWKSLLLPLAIAVLLFPMQVFAAEYQSEVKLPVSVKVEGSGAPQDAAFTVTLEAIDEAPLPDTTALTLPAGTVEFDAITYDKPGDYQYTVRQKQGSEDYFGYDKTVYTVTVRVTNAGQTAADGLSTEVWAVKDGGEDKVREISFINTYAPPTPTPTPTVTPDPTATPAPAEDPAPTATPRPSLIPQTGDTANLTLWVALMAAAVVAFVVVAVLRKRGKKE